MRSPDRIHTESRLSPDRRVYVNRNLRMSSLGAIGFDLDHTLAHYRGPAIEELAFRLARDRLVDRFGYSQELRGVEYDGNFVIRGLVIDKRRGNILKMDYHNYVSRGYHGLRPLADAERKSIYRSRRVRLSSPTYVTVDTLFHLPEVFLFVVLVDLVESTSGKKPRNFEKVYQDVRESIDSVHGDGTLKREILADLGSFIRKAPRLQETLGELRRVGKKLFLLTNSEYYYTDAILRFLLGAQCEDWRSLFDLVVVESAKPAFFTDFSREAIPVEKDSPTRVFQGANARFLEKQLGMAGDQILYFGDHTYGDILRSKKSLGWRTAMVVEELGEELETSSRVGPQLEELRNYKALRDVLESDLSALLMELRKVRRRIEKKNGDDKESGSLPSRLESLRYEQTVIEKELDQVQEETAELGELINREYNLHWGPIFREGQETSRFGHQVKDFACLYMTHVSNLQNYNPNHYYRSAAELMPHELA